MKEFHNPSQTPPLIKFLLLLSSCSTICLFALLILTPTSKLAELDFSVQDDQVSEPTTVEHLVFGLGSGRTVWPKRKEFVKIYWKPNIMRGCVFLGSLPQNADNDSSLPPLCLSSDTSHFNYTWGPTGQLSANRIARMVKDIVDMNYTNVRWYVFGDDDTIFLPQNLAKTLSKYDHRVWYYLGQRSEYYEATRVFGFDMAFGGGGIVISSSLAHVLAKVIDSCLARYPYLYGSDARTYSCITELGVGLTHEPGFHQVDMRGNIFGLLAAHPVTPLLSIHHTVQTDPIFPNMTNLEAFQHLFEAANVDSQRILQQTVCYDSRFSWTISVSWGYVVQIFQNHVPLPDVLHVQRTFKQWLRGNGAYNLNTRLLDPDPCKRPLIFFLHDVSSGKQGIVSSYRKWFQNCSYEVASLNKMELIKVFSNKLDLDAKPNPRRQCCDVLPLGAGDLMEIAIRECKDEELIYMH